MKAIASILFIALISLCFSSCAGLKTGKADEKQGAAKDKPPEAPRLVGRIATIPADKRFVLIQSYGKWTIESGTILTTRGPDERSANLLATGETMGEFAAADLQSGEVEVGDGVYLRHVPKPVSLLTTPETPQVQPKAENQNVQKNN